MIFRPLGGIRAAPCRCTCSRSRDERLLQGLAITHNSRRFLLSNSVHIRSLSSSVSSIIPLFSHYPSSLTFSPSRPFTSDARILKRAAYQRRVFTDRVRIQATGGRGGAGCSSFARTMKGIGAPNGGNGGNGGDVYVRCTDDATQQGYRFSSFHFQGAHGNNGSSDYSHGKNGADTDIVVPAGTTLSRIDTYTPETRELHTTFIADLTQPNERVLVARGGAGGHGNRVFTTAYRENNRFSGKGAEGESVWLMMELRCIADVGLVGFPNAGKSSLLAACSAAQPKIASYPFTTMQPQVGVVEVDANHEGKKRKRRKNTKNEAATEEEETAAQQLQRQFSLMTDEADAEASWTPDPSTEMNTLTMADLPGLITDAHADAGLGHSFLQHLQRCSVLVYVIDMAGGEDIMKRDRTVIDDEEMMQMDDDAHGDAFTTPSSRSARRDPCEDFLSLRRELRLYDEKLLQKPYIIFGNQMDRRPAQSRKNLIRLKEVIESELMIERQIQGRSRSRTRAQQQGHDADTFDVMSSLSVDDILISGSCVERRGLQKLVKQLYKVVQLQQQSQLQVTRDVSSTVHAQEDIQQQRSHEHGQRRVSSRQHQFA